MQKNDKLRRDSRCGDLPSGAQTGSIAWIASPKWVRVYFGGEIIADSRRAMLLRESGVPPVYYFPREDVRMDRLITKTHRTYSPNKGEAAYWTVEAGHRIAENAVWSYDKPLPAATVIAGYMAFEWHKMDAWFEEDEEVFVHPRDPFTRIDVCPSSRHVVVVVAGETVAETRRPVLLFETGLPTRYYVPKTDLRLERLLPSDTRTRCPYKGEAEYYSVRAGKYRVKDIAWSYRYPLPEVARIASCVSFFNERVDALYVDGQLQPKERTVWSRWPSDEE